MGLTLFDFHGIILFSEGDENEAMSLPEYLLSHHGSRLWGRAKGVEVREQIEAMLSNMGEGEVLVLNIKDVEVMDFSFASEVFGKLLARMPTEYSGRYVVLREPTEYVKENLQAALVDMELAVLIIRGKKWDVIGKFGQADRETLQALVQLGVATTSNLAKELGISITACSNRLKKLHELGLIRRERTTAPSGGEQYQYAWLLK